MSAADGTMIVMDMRNAVSEILARWHGEQVTVSVRADHDQLADDVGFHMTLHGSHKIGRLDENDDVALDFSEGSVAATVILRHDRFMSAEWVDVQQWRPDGTGEGVHEPTDMRLLRVTERGRVVEFADVS